MQRKKQTNQKAEMPLLIIYIVSEEIDNHVHCWW